MKILNTAAGVAGSRILGRPFYARFHVTYRCNYRCGMCAVPQRAVPEAELRIDAVRTVAARLWSLGARHAVITGGEPFLRRDLPEIIGAFGALGFSVRVQTNGGPQVTRAALARAAAAGLRDISVSIDSLDRALQDEICGRRGVVDHALRTLQLARTLLPRGISQANIVASRLNFSALPDLVEFFARQGVYTYITPVVIDAGCAEGGGEFLFRSHDARFAFDGMDPVERDRVIDRLVALRREGRGLTNSTRFLEDFRGYVATGRCAWDCAAAQLTIDVQPDGGFSFCKEKPAIANILEPGFMEAYRDGRLREAARAQATGCSGCFYGEYREPQYAVRDGSVFLEWVRDWLLTFRHGMQWDPARAGRPAPPTILPAVQGTESTER